jgi:hypothetical protein
MSLNIHRSQQAVLFWLNNCPILVENLSLDPTIWDKLFTGKERGFVDSNCIYNLVRVLQWIFDLCQK